MVQLLDAFRCVRAARHGSGFFDRRFRRPMSPVPCTWAMRSTTRCRIFCAVIKEWTDIRVLWVPGTDHAGIATQNVVERRLAAIGLTRAEIGRAEFIHAGLAMEAEAGNTILHQLKALGVSCDWDHERFTMDEGLSRAVREAFVRLWEDGFSIAARDSSIGVRAAKPPSQTLKWSTKRATAPLAHSLPLADDPDSSLIVATTRPETMLGDTAVAVHPDDPRYNEFVGKKVGFRLPAVTFR